MKRSNFICKSHTLWKKKVKKLQMIDALSFDRSNMKKSSMNGNVWTNPNQLSEEMVHCMRDIFLRLSESSKISPKLSSENSSLSAEHLSDSSLTSMSDSSLVTSVLQSPSVDSNHNGDIIDEVGNFDPYNVNGKEARREIGNYCSVAEVSWMHVGKEQLIYASDALKKFSCFEDSYISIQQKYSRDLKPRKWEPIGECKL